MASNGVQAPKPAAPETLARLQGILQRFDITITQAQDLVALEDYEIVIIADDSGSMNTTETPAEMRTLGQPSRTRWEELKETCSLIVELGCCFDRSGVDLFFLNRGKVEGIQGSGDPRFVQAFQPPARGSTPLTETLQRVVKEVGGERPVLLFILTDGQPNGGVRNFRREVGNLVRMKSTPHEFRVQIMACTSDESAIGWLNELDAQHRRVDVTDDYFSEMVQVLKDARTMKKFTRGDWCMKAMLGPIVARFDAMDEKGSSSGDSSDWDDDDGQCLATCTIC